MNGQEKKLYKCENCVNLIQNNDNYYECDYDYFKNIKKQDMKLLIPEIFDCYKFEYIGNI